jgi:hypothetical protein
MSSRNDSSRVGQAASKLVCSLKRAQWLPQFDRTTLRDVVAEMGELYKHLHHNLDMSRIPGTDESRTCTIAFLDTALRRNRQCVLAYINYRLEKLQELAWWHVGRAEELPDPIKDKLDQEEIKFARFYNDVLDQYLEDLNSTPDDYRIDLTTDLLPPKAPDIEVELNYPLRERPAGSRFYARRPLVEPLVLSGKAKHINSEIRSGLQRD